MGFPLKKRANFIGSILNLLSHSLEGPELARGGAQPRTDPPMEWGGVGATYLYLYLFIYLRPHWLVGFKGSHLLDGWSKQPRVATQRSLSIVYGGGRPKGG